MPFGIYLCKVETEKLQSWAKANVTLKNLLLYSHCSLHPAFQSCTVAIIGFLVNCSLMNAKGGDKVGCRSVKIVLSAIVKQSVKYDAFVYQPFYKVLRFI